MYNAHRVKSGGKEHGFAQQQIKIATSKKNSWIQYYSYILELFNSVTQFNTTQIHIIKRQYWQKFQVKNVSTTIRYKSCLCKITNLTITVH